MMVAIIAGKTTNITPFLTSATWSGDRTQAARKLVFSFVQDDRDSSVPVIDVDNGYTVIAGDDNGELVFRGNIYQIERDRAKSSVTCTAYDNLFVLNKSKTTRKFTDVTPEDIAKGICAEMGVYAGDIARTNIPVSFIAHGKSGYQIIVSAYTEAAKQNQKKYQAIMNSDRLDVIEKGTLIDVVLDASANMTDSIYKESIEKLINRVLVTDETGIGDFFISDDESIQRYSMFQTVYKTDPQKDTATEAKALFTKPEREGNVTAIGDYRAISGYSIQIKDSLFNGIFWIKSDTHTFNGGFHEMKLQLEFENIMTEETADKETDNGRNTTGRTER